MDCVILAHQSEYLTVCFVFGETIVGVHGCFGVGFVDWILFILIFFYIIDDDR